MAVRLRGSYNHHYSDLISDSGIPIGTICSVFVDDGSSSTPTTGSVAENYPGWLYCDGASVSVEDYPLLYEVLGNKYGGTAPGNVNLRDWGSTSGSTTTAVFNLPDLRMKRLNGPGGVDGPGSITPDNSQMQVGDTGGEWYISRARQLDEYTIGTVRVEGYETCVDFIDGSLSGTTSYTVGPLQTKLLTGAPPHTHLLLCSEEDLRDGMDNGQAHNDNEFSPNYNGTFGSVTQFDPDGGSPAEHTHYIAEFSPNTTGSNVQYSYCTSQTYTNSPDAYTNSFGANKVNEGSNNSKGQSVDFEESYSIDVDPTQAGITLNTGTITMTGAEQISVVASIVPTTPVPLVLKYFRVKYLIKAW